MDDDNTLTGRAALHHQILLQAARALPCPARESVAAPPCPALMLCPPPSSRNSFSANSAAPVAAPLPSRTTPPRGCSVLHRTHACLCVPPRFAPFARPASPAATSAATSLTEFPRDRWITSLRVGTARSVATPPPLWGHVFHICVKPSKFSQYLLP